ncbi:unnamed protein product, partial [Didymodactylos carnosus]
HAEIVNLLLDNNADIDARDVNDSAPLHCAATLSQIKQDDNNDTEKVAEHPSVKVLNTLMKYEVNLLARDGYGHNCLEVAIKSKNFAFVRTLLLPEHDQIWHKLMRNAQIKGEVVHTPMRKFVHYMPELTCEVLDKFKQDIGGEHEKIYKIVCNFEFLEDACSVREWQLGR